MKITNRFGVLDVGSSGCQILRSRDGDLYFSLSFEKANQQNEDPEFVVAHIEMAGEKWLRDQGIEEDDRIFGKEIQHLMNNGWLYSKSGGTWGQRRGR